MESLNGAKTISVLAPMGNLPFMVSPAGSGRTAFRRNALHAGNNRYINVAPVGSPLLPGTLTL